VGEGGACCGPARGNEEASESAKDNEDNGEQARKQKGRRGEGDGLYQTQVWKALGDLALGLGGVFRIDLADHAVAAVALGGIEAAVGALDQGIGVVARF